MLWANWHLVEDCPFKSLDEEIPDNCINCHPEIGCMVGEGFICPLIDYMILYFDFDWKDYSKKFHSWVRKSWIEKK